MAKKLRCSFPECKAVAQRYSGHCDFCDSDFCGSHRLLEDHKCQNLENCKKEAFEANAMQLNRERTQVIKGV